MVEIYGDGEGKWILELIDAQRASHVRDEPFATDDQALKKAVRALEEEKVDFVDRPPGTGAFP